MQPKKDSDLKKSTTKSSSNVSDKKPTTKPSSTASDKKPTTKPSNTTSDKKPTSEKATVTKPKTPKTENSAPKKAEIKAEKTKEAPEQKTQASEKSGGAGVLALFRNPKTRLMIISAISFLLVVVLTIGIVLGVKGCSRPSIPNVSAFDYYDAEKYKTTTVVGYSSQVIKTTERIKPVSGEPQDGGLASGYPKYGSTLRDVIGTGAEQVAARDALIAESSYLTATGTANAGGGDYTWMDKDGYLYKGTTAEPIETTDKYTGKKRQLYKHTASVGLYLGDVADDEPGIVKRVTMRPRGYNGYGVTGVYAPAGEVIKIEISEADMEATNGIVIHIGQALYNGQANNIWTAKNQMQRIPHLLNTMVVNKNTSTLENGVYTAYVGSFIGGPIYIRNTNVTFTATISGGVAYSHFILGYTTQKEFEENANTSTPYFDLEVWDRGVLHSGPKYYAQNFSYEDIYNAAVLWDKISLVSNQIRAQGIVFLYDPFVAAGAAVAFPGRRSVNCPAGWMSGSLNYKSFVTSGAWGNMHEFNHNFQGWGLPAGGEVTNNAVTLVEYSLFTKISSARGIGNYGAAGLSGWNNYTSASWATKQIAGDPQVLPGNPLSMYAVLLHSFGQENFIATTKRSGVDAYYTLWSDTVHYDMTYFASQIAKVYDGRFGGYTDMSQEAKTAMKEKNYPMFVPVASVYQTGRSYNYDGEKRYIETVRPFVIPYGKDFTVDLREYVDALTGSVVLPEGFSFKVKSVSQPEHGKISSTNEDKVYTFTPDKNLRSGKIIVTLEITKDDGAFEVDDVDLVLEFEQSHETTKWVTERTTYVYEGTLPFASAQEAYEKKYAGYAEKTDGDNINPILNGKVVQNSNAEVWFTTNPGSNSVVEIRGKYHAEEAAKYRIALRGRWSTALYVAVKKGSDVPQDGDFELAATYRQTKPAASANFPGTEGTYKDLELDADTWVYYRAVLLTDSDGARSSFIGVGWGKFTPEQGVIGESGEVVGYQPESVSVGYVNAYRNSYENILQDFETDYFVKRNYSYSYLGDSETVTDGKTQTPTADCNYIPWVAESQPIENLFSNFTGEGSTGIHFSSQWGVSEINPAVLAFDIGEEVTASYMTLYLYTANNQGGKAFPRDFTLQGSLDGVNYFDMGSWTGQSAPAVSRDYTFIDNKVFRFRYYKLTMTSSSNGRIALNGLTFSYRLMVPGNGNNCISPDNEMFKYEGVWYGAQTASTFGHVYVGGNKASVSFEFEGTRFGILSSADYGSEFEVLIDGKKVESVSLKNDSNSTRMTYLSQKLEGGKHRVTIKCKGDANIDSIAFFNETT